MRTTHPRDDSETARMIASFGNFDVSEMARSEAKPWRGVIRNVLRTCCDINERRDFLRGLSRMKLDRSFPPAGPTFPIACPPAPVRKRGLNNRRHVCHLVNTHECV